MKKANKQNVHILFGGTNKIGGNKVLLQERKHKGILDFGLPFSEQEEYSAGYLCPRKVNGTGDYLEFRPLPEVEDSYAKDAIETTKS